MKGLAVWLIAAGSFLLGLIAAGSFRLGSLVMVETQEPQDAQPLSREFVSCVAALADIQAWRDTDGAALEAEIARLAHELKVCEAHLGEEEVVDR